MTLMKKENNSKIIIFLFHLFLIFLMLSGLISSGNLFYRTYPVAKIGSNRTLRYFIKINRIKLNKLKWNY